MGRSCRRTCSPSPTRGTINVHASLLPKYRGAAPVAYAILNGEARTGVTIIKVTPGLDSGDMILQEAIDILPDDTTGSLEARLATLGAKLAVEAVRKYQAGGPVEGVKQDPALVTKAPKIKKEFGLIDWTKPADYIVRFVRAMQPWPTAYTFLHRPGKEPMRVIVNTGKSGLAGSCGLPNSSSYGVDSLLRHLVDRYARRNVVSAGTASLRDSRTPTRREEEDDRRGVPPRLSHRRRHAVRPGSAVMTTARQAAADVLHRSRSRDAFAAELIDDAPRDREPVCRRTAAS